MTHQLRRIATGLLALGSLTGCLGSAPGTRLYQLEPIADRPTVASMAKPVTLVVREVRLPQYLDRPQIVTRDVGHRLQFAEFDQWAGDLREDLTRILVENLGRLLASERVFAAPLNVAVQPDYRLEVEILRFEREAGGRVQLTARWWLGRGSDGGLLATREASFSGTSATDAYSGLIAAMSVVYGDLARAIADSVRKAASA